MCLGAGFVWALAAGPSALAWAWPADGPVLREFSVVADKYAGGQHRGVDIALGTSSAIRAPVSGEVTFAGQVPTHGLTVTIAAGEHKASLTHLGSLRVGRGERVNEGDPIASSGTSGDPEHDVPYVHLGVRVGVDETYVDPLGLLPPRSAPSPPPAPAAPPAPSPEAGPSAPPAAAAPPSVPPSSPLEPAPVAAPAVPTPALETAPIPPAVPEANDVTATPAVASRPPAEASTQRGGARGSTQSSAPSSKSGRTAHTVAAAGPAAPSEASAPHSSAMPREAANRSHAGRRPEAQQTRLTPRTIPSAGNARAAGSPGSSAPLDRPSTEDHQSRRPFAALAATLLLACLAVGAAGLGARRVARRRLLIIGARERVGEAEEDPGRGGVAVCERAAAHRPYRGLRRSVGHVRPVSPASRERRAHGQRDGRAWHAGHGRGGRRGRVAA
jgi:Peptidase family M23